MPGRSFGAGARRARQAGGPWRRWQRRRRADSQDEELGRRTPASPANTPSIVCLAGTKAAQHKLTASSSTVISTSADACTAAAARCAASLQGRSGAHRDPGPPRSSARWAAPRHGAPQSPRGAHLCRRPAGRLRAARKQLDSCTCCRTAAGCTARAALHGTTQGAAAATAAAAILGVWARSDCNPRGLGHAARAAR